MGRFPRTVTLDEAFRRRLRASYPVRPALADEIQSYDWDYFQGTRWWFETHLTSDEVIAVNEALTWLDEVVAHEKIRLRGALGPSKSLEDIDPADVRVGKLHVFDRKLRVFHGNKVIKTYRRVHCYEIDVNRATKRRSETKRTTWTSEAKFNTFAKDWKTRLEDGGRPPTEAVFTKAANDAGHYQPREVIRRVWRNAFKPRRGAPVGPRKSPASPADDVARLKAKMAAAHPDRGGTSQEFIEAHARYVAARRPKIIRRK